MGFKWFVDGLVDGSVGFGGEESAGASFLRRDGPVWTTDKDGIIACLLAAELTARLDATPARCTRELTERFGAPAYRRIDAPATPEQKARLGRLSPADVAATQLGGRADHGDPDDGARQRRADRRAQGRTADAAGSPRGPRARRTWTKLYAESFRGEAHLGRVLEEAAAIVAAAAS